ncbi:MAG: hypothetical protein QOG98_2377, partial [Pseudonocardiales bacterium]|nr:hypothetical protein [Pseudonocardiales bacterium]
MSPVGSTTSCGPARFSANHHSLRISAWVATLAPRPAPNGIARP